MTRSPELWKRELPSLRDRLADGVDRCGVSFERLHEGLALKGRLDCGRNTTPPREAGS